MIDFAQLAEMVRRDRERAGLTQEEYARVLALRQSQVSAIETGKSRRMSNAVATALRGQLGALPGESVEEERPRRPAALTHLLEEIERALLPVYESPNEETAGITRHIRHQVELIGRLWRQRIERVPEPRSSGMSRTAPSPAAGHGGSRRTPRGPTRASGR